MIPGDPILNILWLLPMGLVTGLIAAMVGLGGGFIIVPIMMAIAPEVEPSRITSLSLAVIVMSSFSGTFEYAKQKRVDFRQGSLFAIAGIPGIAFGSWVVTRISRGVFDVTMGIVLMSLAVFLLLGTRKSKLISLQQKGSALESPPSPQSRTGRLTRGNGREVVGSMISTIVGFISTVLGIGGGIIHVPAMIYVLRYTPHRAMATSQYVLACMASIATLFNIVGGHLAGSWYSVAALGSGMIIGAQFGAKLSQRMQGYMLIRGLAGIMLIVGIRALYNV